MVSPNPGAEEPGGQERDSSLDAPAPEEPAPAADDEPARQEAEGDGPQRTAARDLLDGNELPAPVRTRLAALSAAALGGMKRTDVPANLRPVMRFAPAKRAKLGAQPLLAALRDVPDFRRAVLDWCRDNEPEVLDPKQPDPALIAAGALLRDDPSAEHYVELVGFRTEQAQLRNERDAALARSRKLSAEVQRLNAELAEARRAVERAGEADSADADRMRKRLREQGVRLKEAKDDASEARADLARVREDAEAERAELTEQRDRERARAQEERTRAERALADTEAAREAAREARQGDEVRLSLLLDTLGGAVDGLRRELSAGGSGPRPADAVGRGQPDSGAVGEVSDAASLERLLALPAVHLIVDGYNVSKTGYPDLPLADQRERLAHQLAALASRTGVEVTVVFDGADVLSVPTAGPRGVRVLFSEAGVQADDVIRALVEAEPSGRQLVVATSDRAVVRSVRREGAYAVASAILLARLVPRG